MLRSRYVLAGLAVACACLVGAAAQQAASAPAAPPATATVNIDNFSFGPEQITVPRGTTVTWTNRDDIPHTVTASEVPRPFKSEPLDTGEAFSFRFDKAGRFAYFCSLHAHMQGVVVVQ